MNQAEVDAFLAIVESGSLTRAAQKLYLTQSTLATVSTAWRKNSARLF